jgi:[NiFe] hydrogenase diaphorase moiety large subunit
MAEAESTIVQEVAAQYGNDRTRLMDIARGVHARLGHFSEECIGALAEALDMHRVEVRDMVSFYAFFSRTPRGSHTVYLTNSVVERMNGAEALRAAFEKELGCGVDETGAEGAVYFGQTACIGMSDQAPSALVDGVPLVNLTPGDVPAIVKALREGTDVRSLPQAEIDLNVRERGEVVFAPMERGAAIRRALNMTPDDVVNELNDARLRGRGGAGFPTAMKWNFCRKAQGDAHYIICNADEGEPGTFKDRAVLTEYADLIFEGMTVAGYALGAAQGFLYLRAEYAYLIDHLEHVLARRRKLGLLGENVCGRENFAFDIRLQLGAGAYVCGEESALIESLEGKRGAPRDRPPFPVQRGFLNHPTAVNNVETLVAVARTLEKGAAWFARIGTKDSTGTKLMSISGDCEKPGIYEVPYGTTVQTLLKKVGGLDAQAVQMGGPSGRCLAPKDFGKGISFEDLPTGGSMIVFGPDRDVLDCMKQFLEFFVHESCGWCVPCRVGTTLLLRDLERILEGKAGRADYEELRRQCLAVKTMSRCGLGQTAPNPILTTMDSFSHLYDRYITEEDFVPPFELDKAIQAGAEASGRQPTVEGHE